MTSIQIISNFFLVLYLLIELSKLAQSVHWHRKPSEGFASVSTTLIVKVNHSRQSEDSANIIKLEVPNWEAKQTTHFAHSHYGTTR